MKDGTYDRWQAWRALDEHGGGPEGPEAELDRALKRAGEQAARETSDGVMRWRVLGAIEAGARTASRESRGPAQWWIARHWWQVGAAAAAAVIGVVVTIQTIGGASAPPHSPIANHTPEVVAPPVDSAPAPEKRRSELFDLATLQNPMGAIAAKLDRPFEQEKERLVSSAKQVATFFAERVTFPLAALHREGTPPESRPSGSDPGA